MKNLKPLIQQEDLKHKIESGYSFDVKSLISQTFAHYKKNVIHYFLFFLLILIITGFSTITIVGPIFIALPFMVGFVYTAWQADMGRPMEISYIFKGFKKFVPLFFFTLIQLSIIALVFIPFYLMLWQNGMFGEETLSQNQELPAIFWGWYIFSIIFIFIVNTALVFAPYLIFFGDFSPMAAVRTSWQLARQKLPQLILYIFLLSLISILGIVFFIIGILFTIPLAYVGYYILVKNVLFKKAE